MDYVIAKRVGEEPRRFTKTVWDNLPNDKYGYSEVIEEKDVPKLSPKVVPLDVIVTPIVDAKAQEMPVVQVSETSIVAKPKKTRKSKK
jgi:hypothetical protein